MVTALPMNDPGSHDSRLQKWVERINEQGLATLAATVRRVQAVVADASSSFPQLSEAIQLDPSLSARILRVANSPSYMVSADPVTTVSRAATLIGYEAIRNICITSRLLESLLARDDLPESVRDRVIGRTAASLHAAVQARMMVGNARQHVREEAFIAALFHNIGESAFWGSGTRESLQLDEQIRRAPDNEVTLVYECIGGSFAELGSALLSSWGLDAALARPRDRDAVPIRDVASIANEIADCAAVRGWGGQELQGLQQKAATLMGVNVDDAAHRIRACGQEAEELAHCYGAGALAHRMRYRALVDDGNRPAAASRPAEETARPAAAPAELQATGRSDPAVQLSVLREMKAMLNGETDVKSIIRTAIDGIHRGIGMDRTVAALLDEKRRTLSVRFWLGEGGEKWSKTFSFQVPVRKDVFRECVNQGQYYRYNSAAPGSVGGLIPVELLRFCRGSDFLLAPIMVGASSIGVIYADRSPSEEAVSEQDFNAFSRFAQQLGLCLASLNKKPA